MLRKLLLPVALLVALTGCQSSSTRRVETPVNVTHEVAFGDYRRVFNTTYHIVNRYGVVQNSSYRYGEITALVSEDTSLWDKTRRTIQARIVDTGDYWDVQCRVLIAVEDSEVATFPDQFQPLYSWKTVASDPQLEVRLNKEIRQALTGGAWEAKEPLTPKPVVPAIPPAKQRKAKKKSTSAEEGEVSQRFPRLSGRDAAPGAEAYERLGVARMRRGSYDGAAQAFQAAISEGSPFGHFLLAQAQFSQGDYRQAQESLETGTRENAQWAESDLDLRDLYPDAVTFSRQLSALAEAAQEDEGLLLLVGYMRLYSADAEGALAALEQHASSEPQSGAVYREVARQRVDAAHGLEDF